MDFRENPAIYIQIAEWVCEQVLLGKWKEGERITSIRDLAINMEVNPNTVQRAYDILQQHEIITNKRGMGIFIETDAIERILSFRREQFMENEFPVFLRNIYLLKIDPKEIVRHYEKFVKDNFKNKLK
ncbi:MAG TPA: GntR family transcriptional regulator [Nitrosopumilaceae archaeon]|jgi:GntR family transcriptional regulator|nr:GntR family transcriptional regulator [Nitrosopumilaceae archaeon]